MPSVRSQYTDRLNFFGSSSPMELAAQFGTPLYIYNEAVLRERCRDLVTLSSLPNFKVNYSAKANTHPALLRIIRDEGCVVDAMSPGELYMNELGGFTRDEILYVCNNVSGVEMRIAADKSLMVSVDSLSQLETFGRMNFGKKVMIRLNPGIGAGHDTKVITGGKETKFGMNLEYFDQARKILEKYHLVLAGLNQHIGSLFMGSEGYLCAVDVLLDFVHNLPKELFHTLEILDFGGGFGIPYHKYEEESRLDLVDLGQKLHSKLSVWARSEGYRGKFYIEPGRYIVAECGLLLGTVNGVKQNGFKRYVGTDIGFNVLVRPVMYDAFHDIEIYRREGYPESVLVPQTIVGNICESGDILAKERPLPLIQEGDIIGILDAGAYGFVMSSSYNQRCRPAEILICADGKVKLIRRRETMDDLAAQLVCLGGNGECSRLNH